MRPQSFGERLRQMLGLSAPVCHDKELGALVYEAGLWKGHVTYNSGPLYLYLRSPRKGPQPDIVETATRAINGLDRFIPMSRKYLESEPEFGKLIHAIHPAGISVSRPSAAWIRRRLLQNKHAWSPTHRTGGPIWTLQFSIPDDRNVLEVIFLDETPIGIDYH